MHRRKKPDDGYLQSQREFNKNLSIVLNKNATLNRDNARLQMELNQTRMEVAYAKDRCLRYEKKYKESRAELDQWRAFGAAHAQLYAQGNPEPPGEEERPHWRARREAMEATRVWHEALVRSAWEANSSAASVRTNTENDQNARKRSVGSEVLNQADGSASEDSKRPRLFCVFCTTHTHYSSDCPNVKSRLERIQILAAADRCLHCLAVHVDPCLKKKPCWYCKGPHNRSLCDLRKDLES